MDEVDYAWLVWFEWRRFGAFVKSTLHTTLSMYMSVCSIKSLITN